MHTNLPTAGLPVTAQVGSFAAGATVGPWIIEGELGRGGMSTVYAVVHGEIGKRAALKVVHQSLLSRVISNERVLLEAQVVNRVAHANIVDIFESGHLDDGRPYLVMERLEGQTLGEALRAGRMVPDEAIGILIQICHALEAAHEAGIIHRDLKLDNIFLADGPDGPHPRAKVLDWGIAKVVSATPRDTFADRLIGTPQYVSPEQARGGEIGPASDIYSLGVMAYEMFLEGPPFVSDSAAELLVMHLRDEPPEPHEVWPDIPPALEKLMLAMLAKDADERPTATDVVRELEAVRGQLQHRMTMSRVMDAPAMLESALADTCHADAVSTPSASSSSAIPRFITAARELTRRSPLTWPRLALAGITMLALGTGAITMDAMLDGRAPATTSVEASPLVKSVENIADVVAPKPQRPAQPIDAASGAAQIVVTSPTTVEATPPSAKSETKRRRADRPRAARRDADAPAVRPGDPVARSRVTRSQGGAPNLDPDGTLEPYQ